MNKVEQVKALLEGLKKWNRVKNSKTASPEEKEAAEKKLNRREFEPRVFKGETKSKLHRRIKNTPNIKNVAKRVGQHAIRRKQRTGELDAT